MNNKSKTALMLAIELIKNRHPEILTELNERFSELREIDRVQIEQAFEAGMEAAFYSGEEVYHTPEYEDSTDYYEKTYI